MFALVLSVGLVACASSDSESDKSADATETDSGNDKAKDEEKEKEDKSENENVQESEMGKMTIAYKNKELDENAESGPMKLNVNAIQVADFEIAEDYRDMFEGKEKATVIVFKMKAENTSDDTIGFYPDQATITTDAGDQSDADILLSDEVGGDFIGKVKKEGQVFFLVDTPSKDISKVNLIVDGAHDENFEQVGEQIKKEFPVK